MKRNTRGFSLAVVIILCAMLVLSACTKKETTPSAAPADTAAATEAPKATKAPATEAPTAPALDKVTLKFVLLGETPADGPAVMAEINKKLEKDINATIELQYIPFGDITTKYPLVLASSQDWDVIFGNVDYGANASKGGYREITMAEVDKLMPLTAKATTKEMWGDTLVNGKIYMIPQTFKELNVGTGFYREDLRKKYNVPEIKKWEDFGAYFQAIKDNEKGKIAPLDGTTDDVKSLFQSMLGDWVYTKMNNVINFSPANKEFKISGLMDPEFVVSYTKSAKLMKEWVDKGLLPKNAFAQKTSAGDLSKVGKTAYWANAFENYVQYTTDMKAKGWELGALAGLGESGVALQRPASGNGFGFSPKSKNVERAMMAIDLLHQNLSYNMLLAFGIEGKNYVMKDGKLALAPGIDATKNPYPMYGAGWWSNNRDQWPPLENYTQGYIDMKKDLQDRASPYLIDGFNINTDKIKTEVANIGNVYKQYALPIELGIVKDVDKSVAELVDKMKKAGAEKVVAEVNAQVAVFVKEHTSN
jgi:putative aldouronate transport system substrate-binding protein